jgi:hypothetical protein
LGWGASAAASVPAGADGSLLVPAAPVAKPVAVACSAAAAAAAAERAPGNGALGPLRSAAEATTKGDPPPAGTASSAGR